MLAQLPLEIVDHILGYLDFEGVRSIARVCSAFRLPAQLRLFKNIRILPYNACPDHTESIISSPHLLQYTSRLVVQCFNPRQYISVHSLWPRLPMMQRLTRVEISVDPIGCSRALSALESLGSRREIALVFRRKLAPDLLISDNPLPVHTLELKVDASNHPVATRLVQKCSQSLRQLRLLLLDNSTPPLPFLPYLNEFSVDTYLKETSDNPDLISLFPFLYQHPTITRISLSSSFTLAVQPPPNLLPNLQFLGASPRVIERLIPERPVNRIRAEYVSNFADDFPCDIVLRSLRQPFVSVTTFAIKTDVYLPNDLLINTVQALPKLRHFTVYWPCYEVRTPVVTRQKIFRIDWKQVSVALQGLLPALGKCKDLVHIRLYPSKIHISPVPSWSRDHFVQMVQRVQENGAAGLWSFALNANLSAHQGGCEAIRVGWLDVPQQPTLRGEWRFYKQGVSSFSFSDVPMSA